MTSNPPPMPGIDTLPSATAHFRQAVPEASEKAAASAIVSSVAPTAVVNPAIPTSVVTAADPLPNKPPGTNNPKPGVLWVPTVNFSSRNGAAIKTIWIHAAGSLKADLVLNWFQYPESHTSTHYVIGWSGQIMQLVADDFRAWHQPEENSHSLGIDICATEEQIMNGIQGSILKSLVLWLMQEYAIESAQIKTDALFLFQAVAETFEDWVKTIKPPELTPVEVPTISEIPQI